MDNHFRTVNEAGAFQKLLDDSQKAPVVIFKHSTTCSISAAAYNEMEKFEGDVALVEVQHARELSREIEKHTGIRHESPQVIVLGQGKVVWNGSHSKVTARAVAAAVGKAKA
jgi:bacillithiol system protein YtxJ